MIALAPAATANPTALLPALAAAPTSPLALPGAGAAAAAENFTAALEQKMMALDRAREDDPTRRRRDEERLRETAREMESFLINQMFQVMRKSMPKSDLMDGGFGEEVFQGMLDQEYSLAMARTGEFGLADSIYGQLRSYLR